MFIAVKKSAIPATVLNEQITVSMGGEILVYKEPLSLIIDGVRDKIICLCAVTDFVEEFGYTVLAKGVTVTRWCWKTKLLESELIKRERGLLLSAIEENALDRRTSRLCVSIIKKSVDAASTDDLNPLQSFFVTAANMIASGNGIDAAKHMSDYRWREKEAWNAKLSLIVRECVDVTSDEKRFYVQS